MVMKMPPAHNNPQDSMFEHFMFHAHHSVASAQLNRIVDLIEGTPGYDIRQLSDEIFSRYPVRNNNAILIEDYNKLKSLREKIVYLASRDFVYNPQLPNTKLTQQQVLNSISRVTAFVSKNILPRIAPSESRIVRSAILSTLDIPLTQSELGNISTVSNKIQALLEDKGFSDYALTMHFSAGTIAQRLSKIHDACIFLHENDLFKDLDNTIKQEITGLRITDRLAPLSQMNAAYQQVAEAFNSVRNGYRHFGNASGPIHPVDIKKTEAVLGALGLNFNAFVLPVPVDINKKPHNQFQDISVALLDVEKNPGFTLACHNEGITESQFSKFFVSYIGIERLRRAKANLENTKDSLLGLQRKATDISIDAWRNTARDNIARIATQSPISQAGINQLSDYLERDSSIFAKTKRDDDKKIEEGLKAVLVEKCPSLEKVDLENMVKFIRGQGNMVQELLYTKNNPFIKEEKGITNFFHTLTKTETARQGVVKAIGPVVKGASRFIESITKRVATGVANLSITGTDKIAKAGNWVANKTRPEIKAKTILGRTLQRATKYPFYWLTAGPSKTLGFLAGSAPREIIAFTKKSVEGIYSNTVGAASDALPNDNVKTMTDILGVLIDRGTGILGKTASWGARKGYERLSLEEKRQVFEQLAGAREEAKVASMLKTLGLASSLNMDVGLDFGDWITQDMPEENKKVDKKDPETHTKEKDKKNVK